MNSPVSAWDRESYALKEPCRVHRLLFKQALKVRNLPVAKLYVYWLQISDWESTDSKPERDWIKTQLGTARAIGVPGSQQWWFPVTRPCKFTGTAVGDLRAAKVTRSCFVAQQRGGWFCLSTVALNARIQLWANVICLTTLCWNAHIGLDSIRTW